jgi:Recombination endonuclease VII
MTTEDRKKADRERARARYQTDPEYRAKTRARNKKYAKEHPEIERRRSWRRKGLPLPSRPRPERCEICNQLPGKRALHLDHCHLTGVFRGWLCSECNFGIGKFKDSSDLLIAAARYLRNTELVS